MIQDHESGAQGALYTLQGDQQEVKEALKASKFQTPNSTTVQTTKESPTQLHNL